MFGDIKISPSILSADFMNFERDIRMLERGGTDFIHVDVMDGHFVPNLTLGVPFVSQLKKITDIPLDVHLMISNPLEQLDWYLKGWGRLGYGSYGSASWGRRGARVHSADS